MRDVFDLALRLFRSPVIPGYLSGILTVFAVTTPNEFLKAGLYFLALFGLMAAFAGVEIEA